nr:aldolase/citrate lyase family protein [Deinococcus sp. KSM4-11]
MFAPANRADLIAKLPRSAPDAVILDLEDAVPARMKPAARRTVVASCWLQDCREASETQAA